MSVIIEFWHPEQFYEYKLFSSLIWPFNNHLAHNFRANLTIDIFILVLSISKMCNPYFESKSKRYFCMRKNGCDFRHFACIQMHII